MKMLREMKEAECSIEEQLDLLQKAMYQSLYAEKQSELIADKIIKVLIGAINFDRNAQCKVEGNKQKSRKAARAVTRLKKHYSKCRRQNKNPDERQHCASVAMVTKVQRDLREAEEAIKGLVCELQSALNRIRCAQTETKQLNEQEMNILSGALSGANNAINKATTLDNKCNGQCSTMRTSFM